MKVAFVLAFCLVMDALVAASALAQNDAGSPPQGKRPRPSEIDDGRGPPREARPFGPPPLKAEVKLLEQFDKNGDGYLDDEERPAARIAAKEAAAKRPSFRGRRGPPGQGFGRRPPGPDDERARREQEMVEKGDPLNPEDVDRFAEAGLYDPDVIRTLFLTFTANDWEEELDDFHGTDVDVPATLVVDGNRYPLVGVRFRGMSSYMAVPRGHKRSLNVSLDLADHEQRLLGYKTLNLLNAHGDPSFLSSVLYSQIARKYTPAPKANLVRVVVNGEDWGLYTNAQQFDKIFTKEHFDSTKGARWKVPGSPAARGGLEYLGDEIAPYKEHYEIKSKDKDRSWEALITLCKTLNETPPSELPQAIEPMLDVDRTLWFLALDVTLINNDGYWIRASDYSMYLDPDGKFHLLPHDMNEAFRTPHGPPRPPMRSDSGPRPGNVGSNGNMPPPGFPSEVGLFESVVDHFGHPSFRHPPPPPFIPPPPGTVLPPELQEFLHLRPDQYRELSQLQKEVHSRLDQILDHKQRDMLTDLRRFAPPPVGVAGPPPGVQFYPPPGGKFGPPPGGGPPMGGSVELDPLVGLNDATKPLRSKLLAVPSYRQRYLEYVRTIAEESLNWNELGPFVAQQREMMLPILRSDRKKLSSLEFFEQSTSDSPQVEKQEDRSNRDRQHPSLRSFVEQRRRYLLEATGPKGDE